MNGEKLHKKIGVDEYGIRALDSSNFLKQAWPKPQRKLFPILYPNPCFFPSDQCMGEWLKIIEVWLTYGRTREVKMSQGERKSILIEEVGENEKDK